MSTISTRTNNRIDPFTLLPNEITEYIFRLLDANALLNASRVSKNWRNICKGDLILRRTARHHLLEQKQNLYDLEKIKTKKRQKKQLVKVNKRIKLTVRQSVPGLFNIGPSGVVPGRTDSNGKILDEQNVVTLKRTITRLR